MSSLKEHLEQEHKLSNSSQYIWEVVYGGIDGIVTTFAVVAGFVGAGATETLGQLWPLAVVLFGLANLFGDGVSMALGKYLSTKSEQDIYKRAWDKEHYEIIHNTSMEIEESIEILNQQGMQKDHAWQIVDIMRQYPDLRVKWMMDNELWMSDVREDKPVIQGLITLFAFILFGAVPLIPYIFLWEGTDLWITSVIMTWLALVLLGVVRRAITWISFVGTVSQIVVLWAAAAAVAYWTGDIVMKLQG